MTQRMILRRVAYGLIGMVFCSVGVVSASETASIDRGMTLFNDPALGGSTNPTSCGTCHPGGGQLAKAAGREDLAGLVNVCVERPLSGTALAEDSVEMQSLLLYIRSLKAQ